MVKDYAESLHLPYKYWLSDSRWYLHGNDGGVVTWDPMPEFFSQGFPNLTKRLGWKLVAHNRYFSSQSTYAKQNGGQYEFIVQGNSSLPMDAAFWTDLFAARSDWGLAMLFQDWLYTVSDGIDAVNEVPGVGETWLRQMANGAEAAGVSIQYCMALARHLFASVQHRAVTQIRVSNDGMPNDMFNQVRDTARTDTHSSTHPFLHLPPSPPLVRVEPLSLTLPLVRTPRRCHCTSTHRLPPVLCSLQWQIGESAILAYALGVIPFKDNFWTTEKQCDNQYYAGNCTEPNTVLESVVASFSTGAVAPGDGVGQANASLILRSCTSEGRLLKPSRPMGSLDRWYAANAFTPGGVEWQLQSTHTELDGWRWHYVLAVNNPELDAITREDLHVGAGAYYQWRSLRGVDDWSTLEQLRKNHTIPASTLPDFTLTHLAPVMDPSGVVLLGEADKWVRVSGQRIGGVDVTQGQVSLRLMGAQGEVVRMLFTVPAMSGADVQVATCTIPAVGKTWLRIGADESSVWWACNGVRREVGRGQGASEAKLMAE